MEEKLSDKKNLPKIFENIKIRNMCDINKMSITEIAIFRWQVL